jgi:DNA-binding NtrC family response regulator
MAAQRILYVSYNPATLIRDEHLLMRSGYEVDSVFGADGLMACGSIAEYASVLIDHACPRGRRRKMISWLQSTYPKVDILPATSFTRMQPSGTAGLLREGIYLREAMRTFANCRV